MTLEKDGEEIAGVYNNSLVLFPHYFIGSRMS